MSEGFERGISVRFDGSQTEARRDTRRNTARASEYDRHKSLATVAFSLLGSESSSEQELYSTQIFTDDRERINEDWRDYSAHPSYTKVNIPYPTLCRERYMKQRKMYEERFQYEIENTIDRQSCAFDAIYLVRHLAITTLWPPLHTRKEIDRTSDNFFKMTRKERKRLEVVLNNKIE